ncbi:cupin [Streptomyces sp. G1]|uniref:cupin n=1 Tax=Streptomyces sp. G1 TaxID=361572 RepID=UPI00202DF9A9|nr:cupin [Streptomyces sp. G1]MCM1964842.1 cupin [Streptomyces sp. G1]
MPSAGLRRYVEAVPGEPMPHGLLTGCTTVITVTDPHELLGTEWRPLSCAEVRDTSWCPDDDESPAVIAPKEFDRPGICTAAPVTLVAGAECSTIGFSYPEAVEQATETLRLGEQRGLEDWFMREVLCTIGEDLTPAAGALSVAQGIGALESWLATEYGGRGVLHVPVGVGALLGCCNIAHAEDDSLRTLAGNCLVLGAGYAVNVGPPDCTAADPGEAWLYVTSPIRVRRDAPAIVPDTSGASVNTSTNDRRVLAESTFVVEIACCRAAAIRVTLC